MHVNSSLRDAESQISRINAAETNKSCSCAHSLDRQCCACMVTPSSCVLGCSSGSPASSGMALPAAQPQSFFSVHRLLAFARSINTLLHVAGQLKQLVIMFILETRVNQEFGAGEGPDTQSKDSCSKTFLPTRCWFGACLHWNSAAEEGAWVG